VEPVLSIEGSFRVGQVVKTRITYLDLFRRRIFASIRKVFTPQTGAEIGERVRGTITYIDDRQKKVLVTLDPSGVDAYVSFAQLTKKLKLKKAAMRETIAIGQVIEDLFVHDKDTIEGFVLCSFHPVKTAYAEKAEEDTLKPVDPVKGAIADFAVGQIVDALVIGRIAMRTKLIVEGHPALLSATDTCDDYTSPDADHLPEVGATVRATVVGIVQKTIYLSTRRSRLEPESELMIVDPEISSTSDLKVGQVVRGFVLIANETARRILIGRRNVMAMVSTSEPAEVCPSPCCGILDANALLFCGGF
jgi:ribosomal protein S1